MTTTVQPKLLTDKKFPFCPGCGHGIAINNLNKVLMELGYQPEDITVVSDIGCSGLIDPLFATHTIHGLHGRSPALGLGVAMGLQQKPRKKTIAFIGDGGATIGLQHILEDARRNVDMTLIVLNNLLYGMTGGQISGLSTQKYKEIIDFEKDIPPFDIIKLAHASGARYAARVNSPKGMKDALKKAIETPGFSIVEIASLCPSYGVKRLNDLIELMHTEEEYENPRPDTQIIFEEKPSLFDKQPVIQKEFDAPVKERKGVILAGSAGGGVQSVGKFLATAGIKAGLHTTMKGEYPITVGTGFSVAEVILDPQTIHYTGLQHPDIAVIVTGDGLNKIKNRLGPDTKVYIDEKLAGELDINVKEKISLPFNKTVNRKSAMLLATAYMLKQEKWLPLEALVDVLQQHRLKDIFMATIERLELLES